MASLCGSTEKKSAGKDLRGQASYDPKYDTHHLKKKKSSSKSIASTGAEVMIYYDYDWAH